MVILITKPKLQLLVGAFNSEDIQHLFSFYYIHTIHYRHTHAFSYNDVSLSDCPLFSKEF